MTETLCSPVGVVGVGREGGEALQVNEGKEEGRGGEEEGGWNNVGFNFSFFFFCIFSLLSLLSLQESCSEPSQSHSDSNSTLFLLSNRRSEAFEKADGLCKELFMKWIQFKSFLEKCLT